MPECSCDICKSACSHKPGWFLPEQIKPLADHLNLTEQELFDKYLLVDYITVIDHDLPKDLEDLDEIFVLSPGIKSHRTGSNFPVDPRGECIWFKDGKCSIHSVKPFECSEYDHDTSKKENQKRHEYDIPYKWLDHQDYITSLLGQEPEVNTSLRFGLLMDILTSSRGKC
jgi:Fe-S-cluster containining protein